MFIKTMLVTPDIKSQVVCENALEAIRGLDLDNPLEFVVAGDFICQPNSSASFVEMCPLDLLKENNEKVKKYTNGKSKFAYEFVIVVGELDGATMMHFMKCMHQQVFKKVLIIDFDVNKESFNRNCPPQTGVNLIKHMRKLTDTEGLVKDILDLHLDKEEFKKFKKKTLKIAC